MKKLLLLTLIAIAPIVAMEEADEKAGATAQVNYIGSRKPPSDPLAIAHALYFACEGCNAEGPSIEDALSAYVQKCKKNADKQLFAFWPHWYTVQAQKEYVGSISRDTTGLKAWFKCWLEYKYFNCGLLRSTETSSLPVEEVKQCLLQIEVIKEVKTTWP